MSDARRARGDWMVRVIRSDADQGDFDREFWARQTPPQRLEDVAELERAPD